MLVDDLIFIEMDILVKLLAASSMNLLNQNHIYLEVLIILILSFV